MDPAPKKALNQLYLSSIRHSHFNHMTENKYTASSKLQTSEVLPGQQIDQNTFRLMPGFKMPQDNVDIYKKTGRMHAEPDSLFSCFGNRKKLNLQLRNTKFTATNNETLIYFLDFNLISAQIVNKGDYFIIEVQRSKKQFYFQPIEKQGKGQIVGEWVDLLNKVIKQSQGKPKGYTYLPSMIPTFYESYAIDAKEFQKCANSGDILLYRSEHSAARVQQVFTGSEYDHVGIVLRNKKNQLFVFQSSSSDGVGLTPWKHVIKFQWYKCTEKIAWRRLIAPIDAKAISIMQAYVVKTLGKEFQLNLDKLFQFTSTLQRTNQQQSKKTYFCSQLVARMYKQLGFLDEQKSSTRYFPVDFSAKGKIQFKNKNIELGKEMVIAFNL